jgi:hypothetical protein
MPKTITPALGLDSFSCPHCGALAHQVWFRCWIDAFKSGLKPSLYTADGVNHEYIEQMDDQSEKARVLAFVERLSKHELTYRNTGESAYGFAEMMNLSISSCHSCAGFSVWVAGSLIYPTTDAELIPQEDMPPTVKADFNEAANIFEKSPRGAAALLRLAIQKLMPSLGQKGENLNSDIGALVRQGLDPVVQQALDVVRVVGNNAVHPGQIDLNDNRETASKLFGLVNLIVLTMITARKQIAEMFDGLPQSAKDAVEKRDGPKPTPG